MGIKMIAAKTAVVLCGITALAAPATAWAHPTPPGGGGGADCTPYITALSKSGSTLKWTVKVDSCPQDGNFLIENDYWDATHSSGPNGGPDSTCGHSACTHSFSASISGHTGDKFCVASDTESDIPGLGTLLSGGEVCT